MLLYFSYWNPAVSTQPPPPPPPPPPSLFACMASWLPLAYLLPLTKLQTESKEQVILAYRVDLHNHSQNCDLTNNKSRNLEQCNEHQHVFT